MASKCSFTTDCQNLFGTANLYEILNLSTAEKNKHTAKEGRPEAKCSQSEASNSKSAAADWSEIATVKRAYYKASLKWHPDRAPSENEADKATATKKFQIISKAYTVLSDKEKRAVYDETGIIDEEGYSGDSGQDWSSLWRRLFKTVTSEDIQEFAESYKGSAEERDDIKAAYLQHEGDIGLIIDSVFCAEVIDDEERFRTIIQTLIDENEIEPLPKFTGETKAKARARKRKAEKEAKEADAALKAIRKKEGFGGSSDGKSDLESMILSRRANRETGMNSLLENLEAKYGPASKGAKKTSRKK